VIANIILNLSTNADAEDTQAPGGGGNINPIAGRITTLANHMRQIQFALKLIF
jgi:hypothetical protein